MQPLITCHPSPHTAFADVARAKGRSGTRANCAGPGGFFVGAVNRVVTCGSFQLLSGCSPPPVHRFWPSVKYVDDVLAGADTAGGACRLDSPGTACGRFKQLLAKLDTFWKPYMFPIPWTLPNPLYKPEVPALGNSRRANCPFRHHRSATGGPRSGLLGFWSRVQAWPFRGRQRCHQPKSRAPIFDRFAESCLALLEGAWMRTIRCGVS